MKKIYHLIFLSALILLLVFTISCSTETPPTDNKQPPTVVDGSPIRDDDNSTPEPAKPADDVKVPDTDNVDEPVETIKYYVNINYFIKPLDPNQPNKVVLLTFDDAPQNKFTTEILDILDKHQAKALFFVNGHYAVKNQELLKEIADRGHIIGNHTWWHKNLKTLDYEKTKEEIIKVNDLIEEITGERPKYFRPPFGVMSDFAREILTLEQMQSMNWSLGSLDWEYSSPSESDKVINQVINNLTKGANILMHDKEVTALALDSMLTQITELGYTFVLPTELILE